MQIKVGTDILSKERFLKSVKNGQDNFLEKIFTPSELKENTPEQLASIFCLKEALIKALELPGSSWLNILTQRQKNGKVAVSFLSQKQKIISLDTSISHEGKMIIAVAAVILDNN